MIGHDSKVESRRFSHAPAKRLLRAGLLTHQGVSVSRIARGGSQGSGVRNVAPEAPSIPTMRLPVFPFARSGPG